MSTLLLPVSAIAPTLGLIAITPDPIAFHLGPISVFWYGICYAIGLAAVYVVLTREVRRRGMDVRLVDNGIIIVAVAALAGGRLYHVIDQWSLYADNPLKIILPPYTGLGVYGGIATGVAMGWYLTRRWHQEFWKWADVVAPAIFVMEAIGRWGNFFNQELYGPPTNLPWGIAIDCAHRVGDHGIAQYACDQFPVATTGFHPLFLYESLSGAIGAFALLWIARRYGARMRPGDLFLIFLAWYAAVRFFLETFRTGNWTFFGVPTAMLISAAAFIAAVGLLVLRHRPGAAGAARWGEPPPVEGDEYDEYDDDDEEDEDDYDDDPDEAGVAEAGVGAAHDPADDGAPDDVHRA